MSVVVRLYNIYSHLNLARTLAVGAVGFGTSLAINKLAHALLDCDQDSYRSYIIKGSSFAVGTAASWSFSSIVYLKPTPFSLKNTAFFFAIDVTLLMISLIATELPFTSILSPGAAIGWIGRPVVALTGSLGAGAGALL